MNVQQLINAGAGKLSTSSSCILQSSNYLRSAQLGDLMFVFKHGFIYMPGKVRYHTFH